MRLTEIQSIYLATMQANRKLPEGLRLNDRILEGPPKALEALRAILTHLLAERGFAEDYSVTNEGKLIEDLIDALHKQIG